MTEWYREEEVETAMTRLAQLCGASATPTSPNLDSVVDEGMHMLRLEREKNAVLLASEYVREKFGEAVLMLAANAEPVQRRLADAVLGPLLTLTTEDFPTEEQRVLFGEITAALSTDEPFRKVSGIHASAAVLRDEEAVEMARKIGARVT